MIAPNNTWSLAWTFDTWGNRLTQTPTGLMTSRVGTQALGYTNNRNISFTYDLAGNQTNDGFHTYTFNAENQITQMDGGTATYTYDGEGRRIKKVTASETTYSFYGPSGIISEFTTSNAIATATAASSTDKWFYYTTDNLGSAVLVISSGGTAIENNRTLPYGEAWLAESTPSTNDKKFTTYQRDSESGIDYAQRRYYASFEGRFRSVDPFNGSYRPDTPTSWNRYIYTDDDPINHIDPSGELIADGPRVAQIVVGIIQIGVGSVTIVATVSATAITFGGASPVTAVGFIAAVGSVAAGALNVAGYPQAAQIAGVSTNPIALPLLVATGNVNTASTTATVLGVAFSSGSLVSASGSLSSGPINIRALPTLINPFAGIATAALGAAMNGPSQPVSIFTPPLNVIGVPSLVPTYAMPIPTSFGGGGGAASGIGGTGDSGDGDGDGGDGSDDGKPTGGSASHASVI